MTVTNTWRHLPKPQSEFAAAKARAHRVLIVDDHPIVRQGLRRIMENQPDLAVCAEAGSAREAKTALRESPPDVLIADISLKNGDGIELVRDVRAHYPRLPILVLSAYDEIFYAERLLSVGANGYIMKESSSADVLAAVRRVLQGGVYVSDSVGTAMIEKLAAGATNQATNPIDRLSNRELQVLHLIGKGLSTRETAKSLNLSVKTIESHRQRIKRRLGLHSGTQLVLYAINWSSAAEVGHGAIEGFQPPSLPEFARRQPDSTAEEP
jgi:DNA-binding NarL/FixJ family response regulator